MPTLDTHRALRSLRPALLALPLALLLAACGDSAAPVPPPPPVSPPSGWDLTPQGRLPPVTREWVTPEGVRVLVLAPGEGAPAGANEPMDPRIVGRLRSGATFLTDVTSVNQRPGEASQARVAGFAPAMEGLREGERRLVLVPHPLGYGAAPPSPAIPPHADLVFDVTRLRLKVQDVIVGLGEAATVGSTVLVHYRGTLADGTVFDDSRVHNKGVPLALPLRRPSGAKGGVIEGWVKGLAGMRVGGTRRLEVPSHLAYGPRGSGNGKVPPHADLTFVVELLGLPAEEEAAR